jgi:hypothetical protein
MAEATHHLGTDLDEADAKYVIGEMCKRVKSLAAGPASHFVTNG